MPLIVITTIATLAIVTLATAVAMFPALSTVAGIIASMILLAAASAATDRPRTPRRVRARTRSAR